MIFSRIDDFLPYFGSIRSRTDRVIACIPPDKLEWSYRDGAFTPGDLIRHLAGTERYMFTENVLGRQSRYPGHGRELADGFKAVCEYKQTLHAEAVELLSTLTPEQLAGECKTPAGTPITTWKWLRAMVEHEVHHRGQLYTLLGILGVATPPLYGLTEPEVFERSVRLDSGG